MKKLFLFFLLFPLLGAGCNFDFDLNRKVTVRNPFQTEEVSAERFEERSRSLAFEKGVSYELRPTFLNITGTVSDVLGQEDGLRRVEVTFADATGFDLAWSMKDGETEKAGNIFVESVVAADRMFLPAFWEEGDTALNDNGVIWLSPSAFRELNEDGRTEWQLGIGNTVTDAASDALQKFQEIIGKLFGEEEEVTTAFTLEKKGEIPAFPMRIDGRVEHLKAIQASSWFADYIILDNPENPLILKLNINSVAVGAMDAFIPIGVDTKEIGYEITAMETKNGR